MIALKDLTKVKVSQLENKNQFVITYKDSNGTTFSCFQSYQTLIAIYDIDNKQLYVNWQYWDYSKTTLKHFKIFVNVITHLEYQNKQQFIKVIKSGQVTLF